MLPELFKFGPIIIRSYGLMMAAGLGLGTFWLIRRGRRRGLGVARLLDLAIAIILSGLIGARLFYVMTHFQEFRADLWRIISPVQPGGNIGMHGLVFYGGLIVALAVTVLLVRRWKMAPFVLLDVVAPPLALGTAIGRVGCFLNGCCFGIPTRGPLGVVFPAESLAGITFAGEYIHPVQLYMVFNNLLIMTVLLLVERKWAKFEGIVIGTYFVLIGLMRGFEDLFRYYETGMRLLNVGGIVVTVNHIISLGLVVGGIILIAGSRFRRIDSLN